MSVITNYKGNIIPQKESEEEKRPLFCYGTNPDWQNNGSFCRKIEAGARLWDAKAGRLKGNNGVANDVNRQIEKLTC